MNTLRWLSCCALSIMCGLSVAGDMSGDAPREPKGVEATQEQRGNWVPPGGAPPCKSGQCSFAGQHVLNWDLGKGAGPLAISLNTGWDAADSRDHLQACYDHFSNEQQLPYLRIPGANRYLQALDRHPAEAASVLVTPGAALKAAAVDFKETTIRLGRERQERADRASMGL